MKTRSMQVLSSCCQQVWLLRRCCHPERCFEGVAAVCAASGAATCCVLAVLVSAFGNVCALVCMHLLCRHPASQESCKKLCHVCSVRVRR